jgi:hypothetical protein
VAVGLCGGFLALVARDDSDATILGRIFTPDTVDRWRKRASTPKDVSWRLAVLASETQEGSAGRSSRSLFKLRAMRRAWEHYLSVAHGVGLLDGVHGKELTGRLRSPDSEDFRSGISECLAAWYLAHVLGFDIRPRPAGRDGSRLEFLVIAAGMEIHTEVKAPHRGWPEGSACMGDESDMLQGALERANKQFSSGALNLLIISALPHASLRGARSAHHRLLRQDGLHLARRHGARHCS